MPQSEPIRAFLAAAGERFGAHRSEIGRAVAAALGRPRDLGPLPSAAAGPPGGRQAGPRAPLAEALAPCLPLLAWRAPGFGRLPMDVAAKITVCEILGPDGMFADPDIRFGLLFQQARVDYPPHRHAAEELYLVLEGTAGWSVDGLEPSPQPPGAFVHHAPWRTHAMQTGAEPLLAAWAWTGDIRASTYSA